MAVIKCKMCGGDLVLTEGSTIATCEYCGTTQTVPSADNEKKLTLFARANRLRMACDFDKAYGVYEAIVADFPEEAEAYWGLVLCKYGIEYVDDPATGKKIPTCHRSSFDSVLEDQDYDLALENADATARRLYREEGKKLEQLRRDILEVSAKESPYDIFICYKETDEKGERTLDSVLAQDLYDELTGKGYRVFFSRISLEDKLGQAYEPCIFAALNSAKVMLAVGTDYEYFNAVWVKNEWSRFLKLIAKGEKKTLIPCYKGIDPYDLPREFAKLQAQDMGKLGAMQDLVRGVEKLTGKGKKNAPGGMTAEEKSMVARVERGQKRTRVMLFACLFGFIIALACFVTCMSIREMNIAYYSETGKRVYWDDSALILVVCMAFGYCGGGFAVNCTYGIHRPAAHWLQIGAYIATIAVITVLRLCEIRIGIAFYILFLLYGVLSLLTGFTSYFHSPKKLTVHTLIVVILAAIVYYVAI